MMKSKLLIFGMALLAMVGCSEQKKNEAFHPGEFWYDTAGDLINAHGGGILYENGTYYWFGEYKSDTTSNAMTGVSCYSSSDLYNWKYEGIALAEEDNDGSDIAKGCILERPKVIYNKKTGKYVMYFHLEKKGCGYSSAMTGVAVSEKVAGPYTLMYASRPNAGYYPKNLNPNADFDIDENHYEAWSPAWKEAIDKGMFAYRDIESGQMSRDMTLYVDDDGRAYHIYSAEDNLTLNISLLTDDYLFHTGKYNRVLPGGHNEAPAIFKKDGKYYMITSGCTGWDPNAARLSVADSLMGEWTTLGNPCRGDDADLTFHSQSTFILPVQGKQDAFIFMADRWKPERHTEGTYVWLPVQFDAEGLPYIEWMDSWNLNFFAK